MGACGAADPAGKRGGGKRTVLLREVVNGLMYILSTGCQWRAAPKDLPPKSTLFDYFDLWNWDGALDRIHHALYVKCREAMGREASPTAAIIDSHMWTAPSSQGCRAVFDRIACDHMSGLFVQSHVTAGQDGFRDVSSKQSDDLQWPLAVPECLTSRIDRSHHLLVLLQAPAPAQHGNSKCSPCLADLYAARARTGGGTTAL